MPRMVNTATGVVINVSDSKTSRHAGFTVISDDYIPPVREVLPVLSEIAQRPDSPKYLG